MILIHFRDKLIHNRFYTANIGKPGRGSGKDHTHEATCRNCPRPEQQSHEGITVWKIYLSVMLSLEITSACKIKHTNTQTHTKKFPGE